MSARVTTGSLLATALLVFLPQVAWGQTIPSPYRYVEKKQEVGIFVGHSSVGTGRFGFGPSGGLDFGARWGVDFSGPLGLELVAGLIQGDRDVINPARAAGKRKVGTAKARIGTLDARLRLTLTGDRTWHGIAPFVVAGGGVAYDLASTDAQDLQLDSRDRFTFGTSFLGTVGTGVRVSLTDRLALRGDGIFSLWKLKTPPGFSDPARGLTNVAKSEWVSGLHFSLGGVLRF